MDYKDFAILRSLDFIYYVYVECLSHVQSCVKIHRYKDKA